jgi:archaellin
MNPKRIVSFSVLGLVLIAIVLVAIVAAGVGGEASTLNSYLSQAVSSHAPLDEVKQKLASDGVQLDSGSAPLELSGKCPHHSAVVYSTWLTVHVQFTEDQRARGFQLDRASAWF